MSKETGIDSYMQNIERRMKPKGVQEVMSLRTQLMLEAEDLGDEIRAFHLATSTSGKAKSLARAEAIRKRIDNLSVQISRGRRPDEAKKEGPNA